MRTAEGEPLPNPIPRPPGELEELQRVWEPPRGWRILGSVNSYADLEPALLGRVEELIDFVTVP